MKALTQKQIKEFCGHNVGTCKIKITRDGEVHKYGSKNPFDRSKGFWDFVGFYDDLVNEFRIYRG